MRPVIASRKGTLFIVECRQSSPAPSNDGAPRRPSNLNPRQADIPSIAPRTASHPAPKPAQREAAPSRAPPAAVRPGGFQVVFPRQETSPSTSTPEYPYVVIVEGWNDLKVVREVATCPVVIMGGAEMGQQTVPAHKADDIRSAMRRWRCQRAVVLTDPDFAGRQLRDALDRTLPSLCLHAFVSGLDALTRKNDRRHEIGDLGVEYATPAAVLEALAAPRPSQWDRKAISKEELASRGLLQEFDAAPGTAHGDSKAKQSKLYRFLVGLILGLGESTGKQFLAQLNKYDFTLEEVDEALRKARAVVERATATAGEGGEAGRLAELEGTEWWRKLLL